MTPSAHLILWLSRLTYPLVAREKEYLSNVLNLRDGKARQDL